MELQFLFDEKIEKVNELNPGYEDHGSDVWSVQTISGEYIVRATRMQSEPQNEFWWGCKKIFGIDPRYVYEMKCVNDQLAQLSSFPVPKVLRQTEADRQYIILEKMKGEMIQSFMDQPAGVLQNLGEGLAKIHLLEFDYVGNPSGSFKHGLKDFHSHLGEIMDQMIAKFYWDNGAIKRIYSSIRKEFEMLEMPSKSSFVLVDIDPTQFLSDGKMITGLVDTEAYVIAPREFDFIGLEYVMDQSAAKEFRKGYERVMPIPDLSCCRRSYRFLYRLLRVQGNVDINIWMKHEELF